MNIGIFYFSSTGNSLYIAKRIQESLGGSVFYIPTFCGDCTQFERIILVSPVYSFGLPSHVFDFMPKLPKNVQLDVVLNYGGMLGGADAFAYQYAKELGLNIHSIHTIKMPENYTLTFTVPSFYLKRVLKSSIKRISLLLSALKSHQIISPSKSKTKSEKYFLNKANWHLLSKDFSVSDACISCGKCVRICPTNNIQIVDGKVRFSDSCVACLGCYHRCPQKAIRYKNKNKKDRYVNPFLNESDIGKDF